MNRPRLAGAAVLTLAITTMLAAQGFKVYPGAKKFTPPDTEETRAALKALPPGTEATYYITDDSFEKVAAFYRGFAKEYTMPGRKSGGKLPSGQEIKQTFFIFDDAKDIVTSKSWAKVQRPYIGSIKMKGLVPEYHDVRDVTAIALTQKR